MLWATPSSIPKSPCHKDINISGLSRAGKVEMGPSTGSTIAVGKNLALIPIWGLTSGIFTTPVDEKLESCYKWAIKFS